MLKAMTMFGAVVTCIASPTRAVLVIDESRRNPRWKFPGGSLEDGESVTDAAIRESFEETGITLLPEEVEMIFEQRNDPDGKYYPFFCVARVTEDVLDTRLKIGDEDGHPIRVDVFELGKIPGMLNFLDRQRIFVRAIQSLT